MSSDKEWIGWHFLKEDRRLQFPPHTPVEVGQTLTVERDLEPCFSGLHASKTAMDALKYAPGPVVCRVRLAGKIVEDGDKACASERTCLWMADATEVLHRFACWCAAQALKAEEKAGRCVDARCWDAVKTKLRWLEGRASGEQVDAAWSAAAVGDRSAAWMSAWAVALAADRSPACGAARSAAWTSAWAVALAAEGHAARSAATAAVRSAVRSAQNKKLEAMLIWHHLNRSNRP
jgi:hypothetical protein